LEWQEDVCATHSEEKAHEHWSLNQKSFHWSKWTNTMPIVDAKKIKQVNENGANAWHTTKGKNDLL